MPTITCSHNLLLSSFLKQHHALLSTGAKVFLNQIENSVSKQVDHA
jgi:hypothetical protein